MEINCQEPQVGLHSTFSSRFSTLPSKNRTWQCSSRAGLQARQQVILCLYGSGGASSCVVISQGLDMRGDMHFA